MKNLPLRIAGIWLGCLASIAFAQTTLTIHADGGKPISPDLFGIFFEDINYSADGGLYAELIQNRSFEYQATEQATWNQFTSWELVQRGGGKGSWLLDEANPLDPHNPHYIILRIGEPGEGVGVTNEGFDGIAVKEGETYNVSFFARQLFAKDGRPNGLDSLKNSPMPITVCLENKAGEVIGKSLLQVEGAGWKQSSASITATQTDEHARFVLLGMAKGGIALDEISLFPSKTFHDRKNGLRADLAQTIADLHPKFIRFPGGCLVHGNGLNNFYRWKNTIGPVEQRIGQKNFWRYHQSVGLGFYEYFQFCEDIGAKPLPVVPAAVSCQHTDQRHGSGQQAVPMDEMSAYIQDVLDLIEWANGPADSKWGAKRAEAGHPAPFHLEYIGVGNEDAITDNFKVRFKMIQDAIAKSHPEITIIGTVGTDPDGKDFDEGWKFARDEKIPMVDEHYYRSPEWFLSNLARYDAYDRNGPKVYVGEYAAQERNRHNTLRTAVAEAAYLTGLERNGDVVRLSSYAPLLANRRHIQWSPDMIYFTNTQVAPSMNYYVQQMFASNAGDHYLPSSVAGDAAPKLAASCVTESKTGDVILKIVNSDTEPKPLKIALVGAKTSKRTALKTVLAGDPMAENNLDTKAPLMPETSSVPVPGNQLLDYTAPGTSVTVFRFKASR